MCAFNTLTIIQSFLKGWVVSYRPIDDTVCLIYLNTVPYSMLRNVRPHAFGCEYVIK